MYFDSKRPNVIIIVFSINIIKQEFIITFLVLLVSDILLLIDTKILKLAIDISSEYVGDIKDNRVIPSNDRFLVYITFIIKPNSLVIKPPISKINVDFINLFFVSVSPL